MAAATEIGRRIARNPGPLETICVAYSGSWDDPPLPAPVEGLSFAYAEGCQEIAMSTSSKHPARTMNVLAAPPSSAGQP